MARAVSQPHLSAVAPVRIDPELWRRLAVAEDRESFCDSWLKVHAGLLPGVQHGLVLDLDEGCDEYVVAAVWPDDDTPRPDLVEAAGEAAGDRQPLIMHAAGDATGTGQDDVILAYPLTVDGTVRTVAVFELQSPSQSTLHDAMNRVQWGSAWLEVMYLRRRARIGES
ncbi:MAG: hypothetical protein DWQ08_05110, partial [Proteobacteria bacterium]